MKTLLWKEWREAVRWLPASMLLMIALVWVTLPSASPAAAGFALTAAHLVGIGAAAMALALGLIQTLPEQRTGARGLLLTRPVSRRRMFWAKTLTALLVHLISLMVPLTIAGVWLSIVAPETRPAEPIELLPILIVGLAAFAFHPAAVWTICRPARWFGTKTLPLFGPVLVLLLAFGSTQAMSWPELFTPLVIAAALALLSVPPARHAFEILSNQPSAGEPRGRHLLSTFQLSLISILSASLALLFAIMTLTSRLHSPMGHVSLRVGDDGTIYNTVPRQTRLDSRYSGATVTFAATAPRIPLTDPLPELDPPHDPPDSTRLHELISLSQLKSYHFVLLNHQQGSFSIDRHPTVYHRDGYYLLYDYDSSPYGLRLAGRIVRPHTGDAIVAFDNPNVGLIPLRPKSVEASEEPTALDARSIEATANPAAFGGLICDRNGVYWLRAVPGPATLLLSTEVDAAGMVYRGATDAQQLWLLKGQRLTAYEISVDEELLLADGENSAASDGEATRSVQLSPRQTYALPSELRLDYGSAPGVSIYPLRDGGLVVVASHNPARASIAHYDSSGELRETYAVARYRETERLYPNVIGGFFMPPTVVLIGRAVMLLQEWWTEGRSRENAYRIVPDRSWQIAMLVTLAHALLGAVLAFAACRRRDLSRSATACWTVLGALFGVGTGLAVLASYPRLAWAPCDQCGKPARVDLDRCRCGALWEPPPPVGIEVLESDVRSAPAMVGNG